MDRFSELAADVRYALRLARQTPLFVLLTVLALGLGIGANTAIYSVVRGVLLRPLPYHDPDRLVMVWSQNPSEGRARNVVSPANFVDYRALTRSFDGMESMLSFLVRLAIAGQESEGPFSVLRCGDGLLGVLGRPAAIGRTFAAGERDVMVLADGFWRRRFGGDPAVVGRQLTLSGGETVTVIGVMPPGFVFPYRTMLPPSGANDGSTADAWVPRPLEGSRWVDASGALLRNVHVLAVVARLRAGVTIEAARTELAQEARRLELAHPDTNTGWGAGLVPLLEQTVGGVRPGIRLLLAGVGVLLLMASVNVANLVLARSLARQRELVMRATLGASAGRLARQALTESLLLGLGGGAASLLFLHFGVRGLLALAPAELPRFGEVSPDPTVLLVTLGLALGAGALVGLLPALVAASSRPGATLHEQGRGMSGSRRHRRLRSALVIAEVALAVVLVVGAGLLTRSFASLLRVDPGFRPDSVLTFQLNVPDRLTTAEQRRSFYQEFFDRLRALPGVVAAGGTTRIPLGSTSVSTQVAVEGDEKSRAELPEVEFRRALADYFPAMGIPLLRGRLFTEQDHPVAPPVVVINQAMARRLFGERDPIGRRIRTGPDQSAPWQTIVGVIGDVRHASLETPPAPEMYVNYKSNPPVAPFVAVRAAGDPAELALAVRRAARALDPGAVLYDLRPMTEIRRDSVAERRFLLLLIGAFGLLALVLAAIGVYGVMGLVVAERTRELGVRLALGALPARVLAMVVREAAALALAGSLLGLAGAASAAPLMANLLFGVPARDPLTFFLVPVTIVALAAAAALVPGRRAMRLDPAVALRPSQ